MCGPIFGPKWKDKTGYGLYADAIAELDAAVGSIMKKIDDAGIADNTIVVFTSDNGSETFSWPDGGNTPFRGEKGTTYEGGFLRTYGREVARHHQARRHRQRHYRRRRLPANVAGRSRRTDVKEKLLHGMKVGDKTFKTHLDSYNFLPFFKGDVAEGPRKEFFYFTDNGDLTAIRYADWKLSFKTIKGNLFTGSEESTNVPLVTNLRQDPWEKYPDQSMLYGRWWGEKLWTMVRRISNGCAGWFLL